MIRIAEIQDKLLHLIGWKQSYNTSDLKISEDLTVSDSGLYFQQAHPLITLENLACIAPDFKNIEYPDFDADKNYVKGSLVIKNGKLYRAMLDIEAGSSSDEDFSDDFNSDFNSVKWIATNPFSEWLTNKTKASIAKAITRYISEGTVKGIIKNLLENRALYDGTGRIVDTIANRRNLVGFEIIPIRSKGVTTRINRICLQFTKPGDYRVFIMHSDSEEPVYVLDLKKTKANTAEWFDVKDIYLTYEGPAGYGGSWYVCYMQTQLPEGSHAIRKNRDWSKGPCTSCSRREYEAWMTWSKYIEVHPFFVNEEFVSEEFANIKLWDIESNQYKYDTNYGLNLDITVSCDITNFIISQKHIFQDVIMKQLGVDMLREFAYNPNVRTNRHSINAARTEILYEIDGDSSSMKKSGLSYQLELALKAVVLDTQGIDRVCQPCVNHGIKYRTI